VVIEHADPPHHADLHRPEIRSLQQAVANQGYRPDFLRKHGAADGRFYYQQGTDAVIFGVGGDGLHGPREYADTTTIAPTTGHSPNSSAIWPDSKAGRRGAGPRGSRRRRRRGCEPPSGARR